MYLLIPSTKDKFSSQLRSQGIENLLCHLLLLGSIMDTTNLSKDRMIVLNVDDVDHGATNSLYLVQGYRCKKKGHKLHLEGIVGASSYWN